MRTQTAYAGIAAAILFMAVFFAIAFFMYDDYNLFTNYVSDLGINSKTASLFNTSLVAIGFLGFFFGIGLLKITSFSDKGRAGAVFFMVAAISLMFVGIFPSNYSFLHSLSSGIFFLFVTASLLLIGYDVRSSFERLGNFSVIAALLPLAFIVTVVPVLEHMAIFSILIWVIVFCGSTIKVN